MNMQREGRELLGDVSIITPGNWNANFIINPRRQPFIQLRRHASCYEMYHVNSLSFEYVPTCANTTSGNLCLFLDYDPTDDNLSQPFNQMILNAGAMVTQIAYGTTLSYKPNMTVLATHKYFNLETGDPDRLSDCCRLWVKTDGPLAFPNAGKLYMRYNVTLFNQENPGSEMPETLRVLGTTASATSATQTSPIGSVSDMTCTTTSQAIAAIPTVLKAAAVGVDVMRRGANFAVFDHIAMSHSQFLMGPLWAVHEPLDPNLPGIHNKLGVHPILGNMDYTAFPNDTVSYTWYTTPDYMYITGWLQFTIYNDDPLQIITYVCYHFLINEGWEMLDYNTNVLQFPTGILPAGHDYGMLQFDLHVHRKTSADLVGGFAFHLQPKTVGWGDVNLWHHALSVGTGVRPELMFQPVPDLPFH